MVRRTRDEAEETRSSILDAAERVFAKRGVSATSLEDVARAAGVTRGAIYWHFKNKGEVFTAMVNRVALPMEEMVARSSDEDADDPLALLKAAAVCALKRTATDPQCQRVFGIMNKCEYLEDMADVSERVTRTKCGCVALTEQAIRNAIKRGHLPKSVDPHLAAVGLDALMFGLISNWLADRTYVDLARGGEALIDCYLSSLKGGMPCAAAPAKKRARKALAA